MAKTNENKTTYAKRRGETVANRLIFLFMITVAVIMCLLFVQNKGGAPAMRTLRNYVCPVLMGLSAAGIIACALIHRARKKSISYKKEEEQLRVFSPAFTGAVCGGIFTLAFFYYFIFQTNQNYKAIVVAIVLAALAFVFHSFGRDFFLYSVFTALGALLLFTHSNGFQFTNLRTAAYSVFQALSFIFAAALIVTAAFLVDRSGKIVLGKNKYKFLGRHALRWPFIVLGAILLVLCVLACFVNAGFVMYGVIALFALYLVIGIIYTVRQLSK